MKTTSVEVLAATSPAVPVTPEPTKRHRRHSPRCSPASLTREAATPPRILTKESQATSTTLGRGRPPPAGRGLAPTQGAAAKRSSASPARPSSPPPRIALAPSLPERRGKRQSRLTIVPPVKPPGDHGLQFPGCGGRRERPRPQCPKTKWRLRRGESPR